jgi:hypothetical protein
LTFISSPLSSGPNSRLPALSNFALQPGTVVQHYLVFSTQAEQAEMNHPSQLRLLEAER